MKFLTAIWNLLPGIECLWYGILPPNGFIFNDRPESDSIIDFFSAGGGGADLTIHVQDATGVASFVVADATVFASSDDFIRWDVPDNVETVLARVGTGDRLIIAFTREQAITPLAATADADLEALLSAAAPATLSSIDDATPSTTLYRFENIDGTADALEDVFTRFSGILATDGAWRAFAVAQPDINTGPGSNSPGPYVYSETSASLSG